MSDVGVDKKGIEKVTNISTNDLAVSETLETGNNPEIIFKKKTKWFIYNLKGKGFFSIKNNSDTKEKIVVNKNKSSDLVKKKKPSIILKEDDYDPEIEQQAIDSIEPKDLQILSHHTSSRIRAAVAFNPMTTCTVLQILAGDQNDHVRYSVARNTSTSEKVLQLLLNDQNEKIRYLALARSITTPIGDLKRLSGDLNVEIRRKVALNSATPLEILEDLVKDPDKAVSCAAQYKVKKMSKNSGKIS